MYGKRNFRLLSVRFIRAAMQLPAPCSAYFESGGHIVDSTSLNIGTSENADKHAALAKVRAVFSALARVLVLWNFARHRVLNRCIDHSLELFSRRAGLLLTKYTIQPKISNILN